MTEEDKFKAQVCTVIAIPITLFTFLYVTWDSDPRQMTIIKDGNMYDIASGIDGQRYQIQNLGDEGETITVRLEQQHPWTEYPKALWPRQWKAREGEIIIEEPGKYWEQAAIKWLEDLERIERTRAVEVSDE